MFATLKQSMTKFHRDEDGLEAVQVVMIVAIAAVVLIGMMKFGNAIFEWAKEQFGTLKGKSITTTFG
jgi:Flp pilus assembly pilin Flp